MSIKSHSQSGQALLLIIVAMAAILVVALSLVSRSITDVRTTANQEEAVRAFSAAESGVERALLSESIGTIASTPDELDNASYTASVSNLAQGSTGFVHPKRPLSGDDVTTWLMSHDANGDLTCSGSLPCFTGQRLTVCWGTVGTPASSADTPAVEVSILYDLTNPLSGPTSYGDAAFARSAYDPNGGRRSTNSFLSPDGGGCTINGTSFAFRKDIDVNALGVSNYSSQGSMKFVKIRPLYNPSNAYPIGISTASSPGSVLPGQGKRVESTGRSGDSTRKIEVFTLFSEPPFIFDSTVYSTGGISK